MTIDPETAEGDYSEAYQQAYQIWHRQSSESPENVKECFYKSSLPVPEIDFQEVAKQMRLNADILMKEISDHVDKEIERFKRETKT